MVNLTKTTSPISEKDIQRKWHLIDISGIVLGRIAPDIAKLLMGKNKVNYVSYLDMGDHVVVINAKKVVVTGNKSNVKQYNHFSGYPGGLSTKSFIDVLETNPGRIVKEAVSGMLPKNKHRQKRMARLYIFANENHPYANKFKVKS